MRCHKRHATIRVEACLRNQRKTEKFNPLARGGGNIWNSLRYPGCKDCDQGVLAAQGELSDEDVLVLIDDNGKVQEMGLNMEAIEKNIEALNAIPDKYPCQACGEHFEPWLLGSRAWIKNKCKSCHYKKNGRSISKSRIARFQEIAIQKPVDPIAPTDQILVIDFTSHPHLFKALKTLASEHFRLPDQQILYMIDRKCFEENDEL